MSITITTLSSLRTAVSARIEDLSPEEKTSHGYRAVTRKSHVPGGGFRNFYVDYRGAGQPVEGGMWGASGMEYEIEMDVFMNYTHVHEEDDEGLISSDGQRIWIDLSRAIDPTITGLISVEYDGWVDEDQDPGQRWGAHSYTVRYYSRGTLNP